MGDVCVEGYGMSCMRALHMCVYLLAVDLHIMLPHTVNTHQHRHTWMFFTLVRC